MRPSAGAAYEGLPACRCSYSWALSTQRELGTMRVAIDLAGEGASCHAGPGLWRETQEAHAELYSVKGARFHA